MEGFLLLMILIVMLGALGWLFAVIRVLAAIGVVVGGLLALVLWWGHSQPKPPNPYDDYYKHLNDKIYEGTPGYTPYFPEEKHDHVRR